MHHVPKCLCLFLVLVLLNPQILKAANQVANGDFEVDLTSWKQNASNGNTVTYDQGAVKIARVDTSFIPIVNELVRLLVYAACCFKPPKNLQRGQNDTRWVY